MAIEIVDFPIEHGDFPVRYVSLPEGILYIICYESSPSGGPGVRVNASWL